jgi:hypothetical protein
VGYFDALTSSSFKTAPDGRRLFFPYGVLGRGYVLGSEQEYERLRWQIKIFTIVTLVLILAAAGMRAFWVAGVVTALLIAFYLVWVRFLLRGLQPTDERLSLEESMTSQARTHNVAMLWAMEILSLLFVAGGVLMLALDPGNWLLALASIGFFGACAVAFARMLVLRGRQPAG